MLEPAVFLHVKIVGAQVIYRARIGFPLSLVNIQKEEADPGETRELGKGVPGARWRSIVGDQSEGEDPSQSW